MRKPKAKVAKATPIKTARKSIAKINNLKAPGGVHTLRDVTAAFQSILSFDTNRQHNKTLAYQVLEKFGVRAVRDLPVNQYDAVIEAANVQRFQMTLRAAVERGHIEIARRETEARVQQYRAAMLDLHFDMRAVSAVMCCDRVLVNLSMQKKMKEPSLAEFEKFDSLLHERGRAAATVLFDVVVKRIEAIMNAEGIPVDKRVPYHVGCLMKKHIGAVVEALCSRHYNFAKRYVIAREITSAIEIWSAAISATL